MLNNNLIYHKWFTVEWEGRKQGEKSPNWMYHCVCSFEGLSPSQSLLWDWGDCLLPNLLKLRVFLGCIPDVLD